MKMSLSFAIVRLVHQQQSNYADVAKVQKNRGHSTARNLAIGIGIGAGALLAIIFISIAHLD
jgi:hypothetical protein